jgi:hypothetical protein
VVAGEVKNLANQTAKATDEIAGQIAAAQRATEDAVAANHGNRIRLAQGWLAGNLHMDKTDPAVEIKIIEKLEVRAGPRSSNQAYSEPSICTSSPRHSCRWRG